MKNLLKPTKGWIAVRREPPSDKTAGGIIKPVSLMERETGLVAGDDATCTVIAVHPGSVFEQGQRVVVLARGDGFTAYYDEENPMTTLTQGGRREPMASVFLVKEECVACVVEVIGTARPPQKETTDGK